MSRAKSAIMEQRDFMAHHQGRRLVDVPELDKDDWMRVYWAYQAFLVQVRAIVWEAEHRPPVLARLREPDVDEEAD